LECGHSGFGTGWCALDELVHRGAESFFRVGHFGFDLLGDVGAALGSNALYVLEVGGRLFSRGLRAKVLPFTSKTTSLTSRT